MINPLWRPQVTPRQYTRLRRPGEARRFPEGLAQAYLGCEILADVEALTKVYSVVTSFKEWYFNRSLDDKIERTDITMVLTNDIPTRESVKRIAEKIYSMLSDDD
ncbi:hypothetical protein GQ600_17779 [Phytophthora cactorum]|nr:hypothetical protein GQ600_17779 [Phytophthora cactorum]